jgi:predicted RND superfamily exporter protein
MTKYHRIAAFLIRYRLALLIAGGLTASALFVPSSWVVMDRSIERMFAADDPVVVPFQELKRTFGGNEVVMAVYDDPQLFQDDEAGINRLTAIRKRLDALPGVKGVLSIDLPIGPRVVDQTTGVPANVRRMFEGYTHGADNRTTCVACMLYPQNETTISHDQTVADIRAVMHDLPDGLEPGIVAGEPVMISDAFGFMMADGRRLEIATTVLLGLAILICFRSVRWVIIPILVVQLALLLTNGILGLARIEVSMVSSTFTAVITVIGIATVVHIICRFREARDLGRTPIMSLTWATTILAGPIFWACVTDAVGFSSLMASQVTPIRDFGMMLAIGSMMVLVSVAVIVPALTLFGRSDSDPKQAWGEGHLDRQLAALAEFVQRRSLLVALLTVLIAAVSIYGIRWTRIESDFTKNFRASTSIAQSYQLVEEKLGGAGIWDIVIPAPDLLDWDYIRKVLVLENTLRTEVVLKREDGTEEPGLTKVLSLADAIVGVSPTNLTRTRYKRLRNVFISAGMKTMRSSIPVFYDALYVQDKEDESKHWFRIMLRSNEQLPTEDKQAIIAQVRDITENTFAGAEISGYYVMLTQLIESILKDQWRTFAVASVGIIVTMVLALGSLRLALMAMFPNVIPILMLNGLMGWCGLAVNMGAAMIAAVSIGLSIDGSIHYLMAFRRARAAGQSVHDALNEVQRSVGRAMVFSTLALVVGFLAMADSQFIPTIYFGVLVSIAMLGGLLGNLIWLPLLLKYFAPRQQNESDVVISEAA